MTVLVHARPCLPPLGSPITTSKAGSPRVLKTSKGQVMAHEAGTRRVKVSPREASMRSVASSAPLMLGALYASNMACRGRGEGWMPAGPCRMLEACTLLQEEGGQPHKLTWWSIASKGKGTGASRAELQHTEGTKDQAVSSPDHSVSIN